LPVLPGRQPHAPGQVASLRIHLGQIRKPGHIDGNLGQGAQIPKFLKDLQRVKAALE
jgi:hypothetical protein